MQTLAATTSNIRPGRARVDRGASLLKQDPLAVATVQRLVEHILPASALVDVNTARDEWRQQRKLRRVGREHVAAQYFELACAGGRDQWIKVGAQWNCRHRVFAFDIDWAWLADWNGRGCNHPDNDGGNAVARLRELTSTLTGGELIQLRNPESHGVWLLGVAPAGTDAELLAQDLLRQMAAEGFHIGKGMLELPLNNARLPLAGYVLEGHEQRPWIEQIGELVDWIDEQAARVKLTRPVHYTAKQLALLFPIDGGQQFDHAGVTFSNLHWKPEVRSNGFLQACAIRMAKAGHGRESFPLMATLVEAHPVWQDHASDDSKRKLWHWCRRWMEWAERNIKADSAKAAGLSNQDKHQSWNDRVRAGVADAVAKGLTRISHVIEHLVSSQGMSRRLLWERRDLIEDGIEREQIAAEQGVLQEELEVTPTQLIPMGVNTGELPAGHLAVGSVESKSLDPVPPAASAEPATCGATVPPQPARSAEHSPADLSRVLTECRARLESGFAPVKAVESLSPIKAGEPELIRSRRERERAELLAWLGAG